MYRWYNFWCKPAGIPKDGGACCSRSYSRWVGGPRGQSYKLGIRRGRIGLIVGASLAGVGGSEDPLTLGSNQIPASWSGSPGGEAA